jgi:hypothetical protein
MSLRKLERDFLQADIAAVNSLLAQLSEEDVLTRLGLQARLDELKRSIQELEEAAEQQTASAAIFFGGRPVVGARGVETEFGGEAVSKFQDLVSKVLAHEAGGLGQRGVVPNKAASTLHITNVVRGSFGFLFEELHPQMLDTALKTAVDEATRLIDAFGEPDEEQFRTAVENIDQRVFTTVREFFDLMRQNEATLRVVAGDLDRSFGLDSVVRAAERGKSTTVDERDETVRGQLAGVLPDAHHFEFRTASERGTIRGKIDRSLAASQLAQMNRDLVNIDAVATVQVRRVLQSGTVVRENFTLVNISKAARGSGGSRE